MSTFSILNGEHYGVHRCEDWGRNQHPALQLPRQPVAGRQDNPWHDDDGPAYQRGDAEDSAEDYGIWFVGFFHTIESFRRQKYTLLE